MPAVACLNDPGPRGTERSARRGARDRSRRGAPPRRGRAAHPGAPRSRVPSGDGGVPPFVKQPPVPQHAFEVLRRWLRADGGAPEMVVAAQALVSARDDSPARLPDAAGEVRFIPLRRPERLVQRTDAIQARAPHDPRPDHDVHFLQAEPVAGRAADGALQPPPVDQIFPAGDRLFERGAVEAAAYAEQPDLGVLVDWRAHPRDMLARPPV